MNLKELNKPKSSPLQKLACSSVETLKNPKYIKQTIKSLEGIELEYLFCHGCRNSRLLTSHFKALAAPAPRSPHQRSSNELHGLTIMAEEMAFSE